MNVIRLTPDRLPEAAGITLRLWGNEIPWIDPEFRPLLYDYLTRYYWIPDSPFLYGAVEQGKLCAFLMAARTGQRNPDAERWIEARIRPEDVPAFRAYRAYLNGNRKKEEAAARQDEVILLFFASILSGCGKRLFQRFEQDCRSMGIRSCLLWTDETCDHTYYPEHGFTLVQKTPTEPSIGGMKLNTYVFRKEFQPDR